MSLSILAPVWPAAAQGAPTAQPPSPAATKPAAAALAPAAPAPLRLTLALPANAAPGRLELRPYPSSREAARLFLSGEEAEPARSAEIAAGQSSAEIAASFGFWLLSYREANGRRLDAPFMPLETARELGSPASAAGRWDLRVVDAQGAPVAGARVALRSFGRLRPLWQESASGLATGEDGRISLPRPSPRGELWVLAPGFAPFSASYVQEELPRQIRLAPAPAATITVVDQRRRPLAGALVSSPGGVPLGFTGENGELSGPYADGDAVWVEDSQGHRWRETVARQLGRRLRVQVTRLPSAAAGEVVDRRGGAAVPGALVWITGHPETWRPADGEGAFELYDREGEAGGRFEVSAQAPGYSRGAASGSAEFLLALDRADRVLLGRVTDPDGEPVEGARIDAVNRDRTAAWSAISDEDGQYRLAGLPVGEPLWAEASKPAYLLAKQPINRTFAEVRLDFRLSPGLTVSGQVISATPEAPGPVAVLLAAPSSSEPPQPLGSSDADGHFTVGPFDPGRYRLILLARGHVRTEVPIELSAGGEPLDLGTIELEAEEAFGGRVVDEEGEPIAGAALYVWRGEDGRELLLEWPTWRTPDATSATDGSFSLAGLADGETLALEIRAEGRPPFFARGIAVGPGDPTEFVVPLGTNLEVQVLDARRDPVAGAEVTLQRFGVDPYENWQTTDADGRAIYRSLAAGQLELRVERRGFGVFRSQVELARGENAAVEVVLGAEGAMLDGRVLFPDGQPATGLSVYLDTGERRRPPAISARVDEAGFYHLEGLPTGTATVEVSGRNKYSPIYSRRIAIEAAQNQLDIELPDASVRELEVQVLAEDSQPLEGIGVTIYYKRRKGDIVSLSLRTDAAGIALFTEVPQATYEIMAWAPDASWRSGEARVRLDSPRAVVTVVLQRTPEVPAE